MDDKPMLNQPIETGVDAGEAFAQNKIGRLDRLRAEMNIKGMAALPGQELARIEKFQRDIIGRFSELTGLEFAADGKCITPGAKMEGKFLESWKQAVDEFTAQHGAAGTPEPKPTDG
jgi:hypothetical protein